LELELLGKALTAVMELQLQVKVVAEVAEQAAPADGGLIMELRDTGMAVMAVTDYCL
jgi:hypothetical protein